MQSEAGIRITRLDPWLKQPAVDQVPGKALFIGRCGLVIENVVTYTEALFLSGGPTARAGDSIPS
jgi:hypothetical protein